MATINDSSFSYPVQQGFTIIEAVVVLCVLVSLMSLGMRFITKDAERTVNQVTAQQLKQITQAAQYYVQDHYQDFKNNPALTLEWQQLVKAGYLSDLQLEKNHYSQTYHFTITQEKDLLQLLLTTQGGNPINEQSLRQIAALAGSSAGYASVLNKGKIVGNQQSWIVDGITLQPGHLASLTLVSGQEVMDAATFLRRTKIADHPEYNTMKTDLEIDQHLLKLVNSDSRTTLSSKNIELRNHLNNNHTKVITLDVQGSSMLQLSDTYNTALAGVRSLLSSDRLEFIRDSDKNNIKLDNRDPSMSIRGRGKNIYINGSEPEIILEDTRKKWFSGITPAEIRLESRVSQNTSYVGNDKIELRNRDNQTSELNASNLSLNNQIMVDNNFIKIPFYGIDDIENPYDIQEVAQHKVGCDGESVKFIGRLFVVGDSRSYAKYVCMCTWRPGNGHHSYIIINLNQINPGINWPY